MVTCNDPVACNYSSGSPNGTEACDYSCLGCSDPNACNFASDDECEYLSCITTGCTDASACNYNAEATFEDGSCDYSCLTGCTDANALNYDPPAIQDDGSCLYSGCTDPSAANYDSSASFDDNSCLFPGCLDASACNYDPQANVDNGSCDFSCLGCTAPSACNYDTAALVDDGTCDYSCYGCLNVCSGNYDAEATIDDGSCQAVPGCMEDTACNYDSCADFNFGCFYPEPGRDCTGNCLEDSDGDGICDPDENAGCTDSEAFNYDALATDDDGSCFLPTSPPPMFAYAATPTSATFLGQATIDDTPCEQGDWIAAFDTDGNCAGAAQLILYEGAAFINLTIYGDDVTTTGIDEGINIDENFILVLWDASELSTVEYTDDFGASELTGWANANGAPLSEFNNPNAVFNFLSSGFLPNCNDPNGCNYDSEAETNIGCVYPEAGYDCNGTCLQDTDDDGICDPNEIEGCTDGDACNYNADATDDDGTCVIADSGYDCNGNCLQDADGDGTCDPNEIEGCQDSIACNYDPTATDAGACTYPDAGYNCSGECLADSDGDGICDPFEIVGCLDPEACNFNVSATDSGDCFYPANAYEDCNGNCLDDIDEDGVCDELDDCIGTLDGEGNCIPVPVYGCTYTAACNFDAEANTDNGTCLFVPNGYDCNGECLQDSDNDGVCDPNELLGCNDPTAVNYSPLATEDDGTCIYGEVTNCPLDSNGDGVVGVADILEVLSSFGLICSE